MVFGFVSQRWRDERIDFAPSNPCACRGRRRSTAPWRWTFRIVRRT